MIGRLRLIDTVAIAAGAMLFLKLLGWAAGGGSVATGTGESADGLPSFARVLAYARTNFVPPDITMTGTVDPKKEADPKKTPEAPAPPAGKAAAAAVEPGTAPAGSSSERALLERLGERRQELEQRRRDLDLRERLIENAERKLETRIDELKTMETRGQEEPARRNDADAAAMKNLVIMYETMKPKDAARVFDRLPQDVLIPVVMQMKPAKMAEILAAMSPEAAEKLTVALAQRARGKAADAGQGGGGAMPPNELPAIEEPKPRS